MTPEDKEIICCELIDEFVSLCEAKDIIPSLKELRETIPTLFLYLYGPMATLLLENYLQIKTYTDYYNIVKKQIKLNPSYDFEKDILSNDSIIEDISKINYAELLKEVFEFDVKDPSNTRK